MTGLETLFLNIIVRSVTVSVCALLLIWSAPLLRRRYHAGMIQKLIGAAGLLYLVPVERVLFAGRWFSQLFRSVAVTERHLSDSVQTVVHKAGYSEVSEIYFGDDQFKLTLRLIIALIWFSGMAISLCWYLGSHLKFMHLCRKWQEEITDSRMLSLIIRQHQILGLHRYCDVFYCELVQSPLIIGVWKPRILLPRSAETACDEELALMLRHELIHFRKQDNRTKMLLTFAVSVYWFQPVTRLLAKAHSMYAELACDEQVVRGMDEAHRQKYGETIIGMIRPRMAVPSMFVHHFYGGKTGMKKRLFAIMDSNHKRKGIIPAMIIAAAVFGIIAAPTDGSAADFKSADTAEEYVQEEESGEYEGSWSADVASGSEEAYDSEDNHTYFADKYGAYGLEQKGSRLYYEGKRVRCFADRDEKESKKYAFSGSVSQYPDGEIDVVTVKDENGTITGLKALKLSETEAYINDFYK